MVNKIGILNGIFLLFLNILTEIPLGIYFSPGFGSYSGFSLSLFEYGNTSVYVWGIIDHINAYWWMDLGNGIINFSLIQLLMIISCILTILASFTNSKAGKIEFLISILILSVTIIYMIVALILGVSILIAPIPFDQLFNSIGMGFYLLIIILILEIVARNILKKKLLE